MKHTVRRTCTKPLEGRAKKNAKTSVRLGIITNYRNMARNMVRRVQTIVINRDETFSTTKRNVFAQTKQTREQHQILKNFYAENKDAHLREISQHGPTHLQLGELGTKSNY